MKKFQPAALFLFIIILIQLSCKKNPAGKTIFTPNFSTYYPTTEGEEAAPAKNVIYYGLLSPVEICAIFNRLGITYNNGILNPVSNRDRYLSSSKTAINTGVYGVDFGYLKLFGIGQEVLNYMLTIREMSNRLGIPDALRADVIKKIQKDISDPDTILTIMNRAYYDIDNHLRTDSRESSLGLMMMGGWVEALFLATQLVYNPDNPDPQVVQKIAEQKYTLNSLLSFMKNYYDDPLVVYYTKKLIYLRKYFDSFDIYFRKGDLEIDTERQVLIASGSDITVTVETLNRIRDYVARLREELVTP